MAEGNMDDLKNAVSGMFGGGFGGPQGGQKGPLNNLKHPPDSQPPSLSTTASSLKDQLARLKQGDSAQFTFGLEEFQAEAYTFDHGKHLVKVHEHPTWGNEVQRKQYASQNPSLAWIYIHNKDTNTSEKFSFNVQLVQDSYVLNRVSSAGASKLTSSPTLWDKGALEALVRELLDKEK